MTIFIMRRLLIAIPTLIGISLILFTIVAMAPGDPFAELALNPNVPPELQEQLRKDLGIDDPVYVQYVRWASSMLRGNWGVSFVNRIPVLDLIWDRLPTTLFVVGSAYVVAVLILYPAVFYLVHASIRLRLPMIWIEVLMAGYALAHSAVRVRPIASLLAKYTGDEGAASGTTSAG